MTQPQSHSSVREVLAQRRSSSRVTDEAPSAAEIRDMLALMNSVPDHAKLRPWRVITLRGSARDRIGEGLGRAAGADLSDPKKRKSYISKGHRAPLVIAVVCRLRESKKVPDWEQEATAAGVAHMLTLLLWEAGWGSIWRTGVHTRHPEVSATHELAPGERLMGWLYVGGRIPKSPKRRREIDFEAHLTELED